MITPIKATSIKIMPNMQSIPLSSQQEEYWQQYQSDNEALNHNRSIALNFKGDRDEAIIRQSWEAIVARHSVLRSRFIINGSQLESIIEPIQSMEWLTTDLSDMLESEQTAELEWLMMDAIESPFDLFDDPLIQIHWFNLGNEHSVFLLLIHKILCDQSSEILIIKKLTLLYHTFKQGIEAQLEPLKIQYSDFSYWQREQWKQEECTQQKNYWRKHLADYITDDTQSFTLPNDLPRPAIPSDQSHTISLNCSDNLTQALKKLVDNEAVSLFDLLLTTWTILLYLYTGEQTIRIATDFSGRTQPDIEPLIGCFDQTMLVCTTLSSRATFKQLLQEVSNTTQAALAHQDLPFNEFLQALLPEDESIDTLCKTRLCYKESISSDDPTLFELETFISTYDWDISIQQKKECLQLALTYKTDLFVIESMQRVLQRFQILLESAVDCPNSKLTELLTQEKETIPDPITLQPPHQPSHNFRPFDRSALQYSISERFQAQVKQFPDHIAIDAIEVCWTYTQLNTRAKQLAQILIKHCDTNEQRIGLFFTQEATLVLAMLATLMAGKTYVPLDTSIPVGRLNYILSDANIQLIITHTAHAQLSTLLGNKHDQTIINIDDIDSNSPSNDVNISVDHQTPAYIIYTSGSTGHPKGVLQNHRNILHFISSYTNQLYIHSNDKLTLLSSYAFDAAVMDIYASILNGACLCLFDLKKEGVHNLAQQFLDKKITIYHSTPSVYRYFTETLSTNTALNDIRLVIMGGEASTRHDFKTYKTYFSKQCLFVNLLGSTESSLSLLELMDHHSLLSNTMVSAGYPVEATEIFLLNEEGDEMPLYGEIAIKSDYLALKYWQQPELSASTFHSNAKTTKRIYHTGDMGRRLLNGHIQFEGRKDFQVKIRGYRIEIGEIEAILTDNPAIKKCIVIAVMDDNEEQQLQAYYVHSHLGAMIKPQELHHFLQELLPEYMIPSQFIPINDFPMTITGKIDRLTLTLMETKTKLLS